MDRIQLNPVVYNNIEKKWSSAEEERGSVVFQVKQELSFLTFNVWLAEFYQEQRTRVLLTILQEQQADVVALQEVTPYVLTELLNSPFVQSKYKISTSTLDHVTPYGSVLLTSGSVMEASSILLPSTRKRRVIVADIEWEHSRVRVAAVHLESKRHFAHERARQLPIVFSELIDAETAVLMGDFNFCASWSEENDIIDSQYQDLWEVARPGESGFTEDTEINFMRLDHKKREKQVRFDRVLLKSAEFGSFSVTASLLGTEPLAEDLPRVFPSDHFGVVTGISPKA